MRYGKNKAGKVAIEVWGERVYSFKLGGQTRPH